MKANALDSIQSVARISVTILLNSAEFGKRSIPQISQHIFYLDFLREKFYANSQVFINSSCLLCI